MVPFLLLGGGAAGKSANTTKGRAANILDGTLEKLHSIESVEKRLWVLALGLFLLLAVSLFMVESSIVAGESLGHRVAGHTLGLLRDYGLSAALLITAWLVCAYFYEKLLHLRRQNRELVKALQSAAQVLSDRNQQLSTWAQLSHTLITNFNLPRLLELVTRTAAEGTESDCAAVILCERGVRHLRLAAIHERGLQIELAERVAAVVIRTGRPLCVSPGNVPEEIDRPDLPWEDLVSLAAEPLVSADKVTGALLVGRLKPREPYSSHVLG